LIDILTVQWVKMTSTISYAFRRTTLSSSKNPIHTLLFEFKSDLQFLIFLFIVFHENFSIVTFLFCSCPLKTMPKSFVFDHPDFFFHYTPLRIQRLGDQFRHFYSTAFGLSSPKKTRLSQFCDASELL
jgi:hypothetical protein